MKRHALLLATVGLAFGATASLADCREDLAQLESGISQDGSHAPLESPAGATPQQGADAATGAEPTEGTSKDGSTMPLAADPNIAMSAQDAQAQSQGGETAAAQAAGAAGGDGSAKEDAIARARASLDAGDEAGCAAAVKEAKES